MDTFEKIAITSILLLCLTILILGVSMAVGTVLTTWPC